MMTEEIIRRGREAERLREDDLFNSVIDGLKDRISQEWQRSDDQEERESLHAEIRAIDRIFDQLQEIENAGVAAEAARS